MKKVLVSGSSGQLGSELSYLNNYHNSLHFDFKSSTELDLGDEESIKNNLQNSDYDYFVNAGAYTAVDKAESDTSSAYAINGMALYHICNYLPSSCKLIHISTDYVYHHDPKRPLLESDTTKPQSVYAKSKKQGEDFILSSTVTGMIIRTSWVYSSFGKNFVKTMLRLGKEKEELTIVSDQIGTPTYARNLAELIIDIINQDNIQGREIYNYSNIGQTNWADFAREIFSQKKINCTVKETTTKAYNAPAPRPLWSVMSKEKIARALGIKIPEWKESLSKCLDELKD